MKAVKTLEKLGYNPHTIGIVMKELVNRAMNEIRQQRFSFEMSPKTAYDGKGRDVFSSADTAAQVVYVRGINENFPHFGIIAEEDKLVYPCGIKGHDVYFTIDPLCGTKAYGRRQSYGVATMFALVVDGEVAAVYIGDVISREVYGYRPGSTHVWRIWRTGDYDRVIDLEIDEELPLCDQYALFTEAVHKHSGMLQSIISGQLFSKDGNRVFDPLAKGVDVMGGSIGLHYARLWKGEVGLLALKSRLNTPWDTTPVIGISDKLGFVHISLSPSGLNYDAAGSKLIKEISETENDMLVIHSSRLEEFKQWHASAIEGWLE